MTYLRISADNNNRSRKHALNDHASEDAKRGLTHGAINTTADVFDEGPSMAPNLQPATDPSQKPKKMRQATTSGWGCDATGRSIRDASGQAINRRPT